MSTDCCDDECPALDCYEDVWHDPDGDANCAGFLTARVALIAAYAAIALVCMRALYQRYQKGRSLASNKYQVVTTLCCGAVVRVFSLLGPMPLALEEILRSLKDTFWTMSFALIVVFWVEMQKYVSVVAGVSRMRPVLFGTVALYTVMAIVRCIALSVCSSPSWLGSTSKYLVYFFNVVLFGFGVKYGKGIITKASSKNKYSVKQAPGGGLQMHNVTTGAPPASPDECLADEDSIDTSTWWGKTRYAVDMLLHSDESYMKLVRFILAEFVLIIILFAVLLIRNAAKPDVGEDRTTYNWLKVTEKILELLIFVVLCATMTIEKRDAPRPSGPGAAGPTGALRQGSVASMEQSKKDRGEFTRTNPLVEMKEDP